VETHGFSQKGEKVMKVKNGQGPREESGQLGGRQKIKKAMEKGGQSLSHKERDVKTRNLGEGEKYGSCAEGRALLAGVWRKT